MYQNVSSSKFRLFYLNTLVSTNVKVSAQCVLGEFQNIENTILSIVTFINDNGYQSIIGQYKRGKIKDRSIVGDTIYNTSIVKGENNRTFSAGTKN